jgi:hypothetical protein
MSIPSMMPNEKLIMSAVPMLKSVHGRYSTMISGAAMIFRPEGGDSGLCDGGPGVAYVCSDGNMFGGRTPARTWFGAMTEILDGEPHKSLPKASAKYERMRGN